MNDFRQSILESDKTNYEGAIIRDKDFKIIKVGNFEIGKSASFTSPVRRETKQIIRFELPYVVFSDGRVLFEDLENFKPNRSIEDLEKHALFIFENYGENFSYSKIDTLTLIRLGKLKGLNK